MSRWSGYPRQDSGIDAPDSALIYSIQNRLLPMENTCTDGRRTEITIVLGTGLHLVDSETEMVVIDGRNTILQTKA
jgi:hypothetical protein